MAFTSSRRANKGGLQVACSVYPNRNSSAHFTFSLVVRQDETNLVWRSFYGDSLEFIRQKKPIMHGWLPVIGEWVIFHHTFFQLASIPEIHLKFTRITIIINIVILYWFLLAFYSFVSSDQGRIFIHSVNASNRKMLWPKIFEHITYHICLRI